MVGWSVSRIPLCEYCNIRRKASPHHSSQRLQKNKMRGLYNPAEKWPRISGPFSGHKNEAPKISTHCQSVLRSLLLSNPRDLCQGTASHWRNAQPTTLFAAKCVPTPAKRSNLWTAMPCRTHVPHLYRHVVNVSPSIDILPHS